MPTPQPRTRLVLAAAAAGLLLAALAAWVGLGPSAARQSVRLEAVTDPGPSAFSTPVGRDHDDIVPPAGSGGQRDGNAPGLYARGGDGCDPAALVAQLKAAGRTAAWARAAGRSDDDAAAALQPFTPLFLRADVLVTEHGWANGAAATYPAVLQAGSAVLVDDRGLPRTRCTNGNPIDPPEAPLGDDITGTPWRWFTPSLVATVTPADRPIDAFTVLDLDSGGLVDLPARH